MHVVMRRKGGWEQRGVKGRAGSRGTDEGEGREVGRGSVPPLLYSFSLIHSLFLCLVSGFVGESTPDSIVEVTLIDADGDIKHYPEGDPRVKVKVTGI